MKYTYVEVFKNDYHLKFNLLRFFSASEGSFGDVALAGEADFLGDDLKIMKKKHDISKMIDSHKTVH